MDGIVIGVPNNGNISSELTFGLLNAVKHDEKDKKIINTFISAESVFVDNNRNNIVNYFLKFLNEDWLLFIDSDIQVNIDNIYTLYEVAKKNNLGILGGVYFYSQQHRSMQLMPNVQTKLNNLRVALYDIDFNLDYIKVHSIGTGLMLIHRNTLEKTFKIDGNGNPYWFKTYDENGTFMAEDIYFCETAKDVGIDTYICPKVTPNHIKLSAFNKDEFIKQQSSLY